MIAVLAADTGGDFDGVLDYSRELDLPLFVRRDRAWVQDGARVDAVGHWPVAALTADAVLLQYSPANWDPDLTGFRLAPALRDLHRATRVVLVAHEIDNLPTSLKAWRRAAVLRARLAAVRSSSDAVVATTKAARHRLARWRPRRSTEFVPVGANIPDGRADASKVRAQLEADTVVATLTARYRSQPALAPALAHVSRHRDVTVLNLGAVPAALEVPGARVLTPGRLVAAELAAHIAAADVFVATYPDGASTRRGSLIGALRQGVPVLSNVGPATDPALEAGVTLVAATQLGDALSGVLEGDRGASGTAARDLYDSCFTWDRIRGALERVALLGSE